MAGVVVLIAMGAIFQVSSRCMTITRCSHDVGLASAMVHERIRQLQATPWETLTDSESYSDQVWTDPEDGTEEKVDGLLTDEAKAGGTLRQSGTVESVRVSAYRPNPEASPEPEPITVKRTSTGPAVISEPTNLVDEKMVRIDVRLTWTDSRLGIPRSLGASTIVARR